MNSSDFYELRGYLQAIARQKTWEESLAAAGCIGKQPFETFEDSMCALRRMRNRHQPSGNVQAYHCQRCSKWHLGRRKK